MKFEFADESNQPDGFNAKGTQNVWGDFLFKKFYISRNVRNVEFSTTKRYFLRSTNLLITTCVGSMFDEIFDIYAVVWPTRCLFNEVLQYGRRHSM